MKLSEFPQDKLTVEGDEVPVYFEADDLLPPRVYVDFLVHYEGEDGRQHNKELHEILPCEQVKLQSLERAEALNAYQVVWKVNFHNDPVLRERLVLVHFRLRARGITHNKWVSVISPDYIGVAAIDITRMPALTRIMLHEFATLQQQPGNDISVVFDPTDLHAHLATLTVQQRQKLVKTGLQYPEGRLVIFITLYNDRQHRMHADWCDGSGNGVVPNATFSVFLCRDNVKLNVLAESTSAVTLICHTRHFVLNLVNDKTRNWISKRVYDDRHPNDWLNKHTPRPIRFLIASLQPASKQHGVIWNTFYEAATGNNIMPGNSLHGMINTQGCWMLFRNFNWPIVLRSELERIYLKWQRPGKGKQDIITELAKIGYSVKPGEEKPGFSSSYDKYFKFDRNWAYLLFFHEVVGIKYYGGKKGPVNDFNVHGFDREITFPLHKAGKAPEYNLSDEGVLAYHDFDKRELTIGPNLFRKNALGIQNAFAFAKDMSSRLTLSDLSKCSWADVYFYKEQGIDAKKLSIRDVKEW